MSMCRVTWCLFTIADSGRPDRLKNLRQTLRPVSICHAAERPRSESWESALHGVFARYGSVDSVCQAKCRPR